MPYIPADQLGRDLIAVLRRVEAGERVRIMVSGRPVAELTPLSRRRASVPWATFMEGQRHWRADPGLTHDLAELLPGTTDDLPFG